jgi:HK97 family phage major capsid protein
MLTGTALPGEIGKVWGIPVVATNLLRVSATNNTSEALLLNRNAAVIGDRRVFTIKSSDEVLLRSDQLLIVASERIAFNAQYCQAIVKITNIA